MGKTSQRALRMAKAVFAKRWWGYCQICESRTLFIALGSWYRDQLLCAKCRSIPRERALMRAITAYYPNWRNLVIHESSPGRRGASAKLAKEAGKYIATQYDPDVAPGALARDGARSENLEAQTFADDSFDIVVTQDVFEHIFDPAAAIREIMRTLKPGGAHIMSVPIVRKSDPSRRRAGLCDGKIVHYLPPQYHENPLDPGHGALVTVDWGYDIADYLTRHSGFPTTTLLIDDVAHGIQAEYLEIVMTRKSVSPAL